MRKYLFIAVIGFLLISACTGSPTPVPVALERENIKENIPEVASEVLKEPPHPISIPALMEQEFDGRDLITGEVLAETATYTRYFITYKSGELTISGIMNVPRGDGPFPVLILNHGYIDPAVYTNGRGLKREQDYLARQGFVVIHPDYRNHAQSDDDPDYQLTLRIGYTQDVINAVSAVKNSDLPYFDKDKIGMMGHSMGGGVSINVMVAQPDLVDAIVLYAPVSANYPENFERWTKRRPEEAAKIVEAYGMPEENPEFWDNISPVNFLENVSLPIMIHHGTNDQDVPYEWSVTLRDNLQRAGKDVTLHTYEGEGHEFGSQWTTFMERTAAFFKANLK